MFPIYILLFGYDRAGCYGVRVDGWGHRRERRVNVENRWSGPFLLVGTPTVTRMATQGQRGERTANVVVGDTGARSRLPTWTRPG